MTFQGSTGGHLHDPAIIATDGPLDVMENQDGVLEDVYGRPMVMIYNSNQNRASIKKKHAKDLKGQSLETQTLAFINSSEPKPKEKAARTLIRTHVMTNFRRKQRHPAQKSQLKPMAHRNEVHRDPIRASYQGSFNPFGPLVQLKGNLDPFALYPVPMRPHMYRLKPLLTLAAKDLSVVVHNMYPKEPCLTHSTGQPSLFSLAMTNAALFHMIICSSALYMDFYLGRQASRESMLHKLEAIHYLNQDMEEVSGVSDASIGAVAYLAKVEFILGSHEGWRTHRDGMIKMVETRGGIEALNPSLQGTVLMADLVGYMGMDSPLYPIPNQNEKL
ncbi:hypothetical protein V499_02549 [Pseudogymnoascus sp. VKM F-103]|nr:hypothetical protein V499_02549 [Pseudogymnoascus sp. VKM F-103]